MTDKTLPIYGFGVNGETLVLDSHEDGKHLWLTEPSTGIRVGVGRNDDDQPFVHINTETAKESQVNDEPMLSIALNDCDLYDVEPTGPHEGSEFHKHLPTDFAGALALFKHATSTLLRAWENESDDILGDTYPKCLPSFDEFIHDVMAMEIQEPKPELPSLPPVGTLVRARYHIQPIPCTNWPQGWVGQIISAEEGYVHIQAERYLGPNWHEWNNCRVIGESDACFAYQDAFDRDPSEQKIDALLAYALLKEFEVI